MKRRELLQKLAAIPLIPIALRDGQTGHAAELKAGAKYMMFVDIDRVNLDQFTASSFPRGVEIGIYPVFAAGRTVDDCVAIYKIMDEET